MVSPGQLRCEADETASSTRRVHLDEVGARSVAVDGLWCWIVMTGPKRRAWLPAAVRLADYRVEQDPVGVATGAQVHHVVEHPGGDDAGDDGQVPAGL